MMRYPLRVKDKAFSLYCQGLSHREIARRLKIHYTTVGKWMRQDGWKKRAGQIQRQAAQKANNCRAKQLAEFLGDLDQIREQIVAAIQSKDFKTAEGAVRSLATLQQVIDSQSGETIGGRSGDAVLTRTRNRVVETIFQVLKADPVIGPLLQEREAAILMAMDTRLAGE